MRAIWILVIVVSAIATIIGGQPSTEAQSPTTQFWTVAKDNNGVWWFVRPDKRHEFMTNVTTIVPFQLAQDPRGVFYRSSDYQNNDLTHWATETMRRITLAGFKGSGAWSHNAIHATMPYSKDLNLSKYTHHKIGDPLWKSDIEEAIKQQVIPLKNDPNLIGYFLDNELDWSERSDFTKNAETYFSVISTLIKQHDPNHLLLGVRFNNRPPVSVLKAMISRIDVQSVNVFTDGNKLWKQMFNEIHEVTGQPIVISEFSIWAKENASGNQSTKAWWTGVNTQEDRAKAYTDFVSSSAGCSFIIGTDFFQWSDEPPSGRQGDGEDINTGFVDIFDRPYLPLLQAAQKVHSQVNDLHKSADDKQLGPIWRDESSR